MSSTVETVWVIPLVITFIPLAVIGMWKFAFNHPKQFGRAYLIYAAVFIALSFSWSVTRLMRHDIVEAVGKLEIPQEHRDLVIREIERSSKNPYPWVKGLLWAILIYGGILWVIRPIDMVGLGRKRLEWNGDTGLEAPPREGYAPTGRRPISTGHLGEDWRKWS